MLSRHLGKVLPTGILPMSGFSVTAERKKVFRRRGLQALQLCMGPAHAVNVSSTVRALRSEFIPRFQASGTAAELRQQ